jgi:hypothetical protein
MKIAQNDISGVKVLASKNLKRFENLREWENWMILDSVSSTTKILEAAHYTN